MILNKKTKRNVETILNNLKLILFIIYMYVYVHIF